MAQEKEIKWLYQQIPVLIEKKILSEETVLLLKEHYGPEPVKRPSNLVFIITSVLGALLIGAGIILLFGYNWEELSRTNRTILSFIPLIIAQLLYGYSFLRKNNSIAWVEGSSAFLMMMLASSIALISQTYNLGGTLKDFVFSWMLLSIPLLYLMNSSLVCMFYLIGICYWAIEVYSSDMAVWYWGLLFVAIPHIAINLPIDRKSIRANILGWTLAITLIIAAGSVMGDFGRKISIIGISLLCVLLYLIGKIVYKHGESIWSRPFQTVALFLLTSYSLSLCYTWHLKYFDSSKEDTIVANSILGILMIIAIIGLLIYNIRKQNGINYFVVVFPILLLLGLTSFNDGEETLPVILFNLYSLAFGIYYIWWGIRTDQISFVNAGMFFVSVLLLERFFDKDISFVLKGSIFILIGICFLSVNIILMRKYKAKNTEQYA